LKQLRTIQALRAIAALAVMFAHLYGIEVRQSGGDAIMSANWITGISGVDLFFVISGFVMVWVAGDSQPSLKNSGGFLFARALRIYPLWWLFAGAMTAYLFVSYGTPWDAERLSRLGVGGVEHLWKSFLLIPHDAFPILTLGWTLMHEIYFYIVFALILLLPKAWRIPALVIWALVILASVSASMTDHYADSLLTLALFPMTLEFLMGAAAAYLIKGGYLIWRWPALLTGLAILIWACLEVDFLGNTPDLATARTFSYGIAFALIVYGLVALEQATRWGDHIPDFLIHLGDWSYSLYLCHILVISAVGRLFFPVFGQPGPIDNLAFLAIGIILPIVVSGLVYTWFERPILSYTRQKRKAWFS
jgi:peptidoglycan/LPS O-acetylase OafA/YrhL